MSQSFSPASSVVVGIDGSRAAIDAALWAVDEAVSRDIPLRLVYAIESPKADPADAARDLATAELAVRYAYTIIESTEKPVKIEVEILHGKPNRVLLNAGRSAAMICVGAMGLRHAQGRIGSTVAALANSAHCPLAIIRAPATTKPGAVLVEIDDWPTFAAVLQHGINEARLRNAPLRVLTTWGAPGGNGSHHSAAVADGNRLAQAQLDRCLAGFRNQNPDLVIDAVAGHGSILDYLARNAGSVQLVVVGVERSRGTSELLVPPGLAVLQNPACSVLMCDPQRRL